MGHVVAGTLRARSVTDCDESVTRGSLEIDLSRMRFATPQGLVALLIKVDRLRFKGIDVEVVPPRDEDVARYLARAHLGEVLDSVGASIDLPSVSERDLGNRLVELRRFEGSRDVRQLAESIESFASPHSIRAADKLHEAVMEAGVNVEDHSGRPHGFLAAQYFPRNESFEFAIGDSGIGYKKALVHRSPESHSEAIRLAVTPGVSSADGPTRGYGLSEIRSEFTQIGGRLEIYSGNSYRAYSARTRPDGMSGVFAGTLRGALVTGTLAAPA